MNATIKDSGVRPATCQPEPLLAQPGELAEAAWSELNKADLLTGAWSGLSLEDVPAEVRETFRDAMAACLQPSRAIMDLLASPEPPMSFVFALDGSGNADAAWAWLRRQAGLEGGGR